MRLIVTLLLLLSACTVCDRLQNGTTSYNEKKRLCPNQAQTTIDRAKCDKESQNCSPNDVQRLDRFIACAEKLPQCTKQPDTELAFGGQSLACVGELVGISLGCLGAVSLQ